MGGSVEKAAVVEMAKVVQWIKNCCSVSAHRSYTKLSSSAPWTITATYLSCGAHAAPCTFDRPPQVACALTHLMHGPDHGWTPDRPNKPSSRHRAWRMTCCKRSPSRRSAPCSGRQPSELIPHRR